MKKDISLVFFQLHDFNISNISSKEGELVYFSVQLNTFSDYMFAKIAHTHSDIAY